jgi:hypothetical protein
MFNRLGGVGSANNYFNTDCFTTPINPFVYGNEPRTDPTLCTPGIANYDFALYKNTRLHENLNFELRVEAFNLFNRVQFGSPNSVIGNPQMGQITTQLNLPRLLQVAGRITF